MNPDAGRPPSMIRLGLRYKLALAFLAVLLPVLFLEIYDYGNDFQQQQESVLQGQLTTATALAALVDSTFDEAIGVGTTLSVDPLILSLDPARIAPYLVRYRSLYPQYESINIWNEQGQGVAASTTDQPGAQGVAVADREHFQRAMATGRPVVSAVIEARTTNRPSAAVVVPIKDASGRDSGAISILLDLTQLPSRFRLVPGGANQVVVVADAGGRLAIHTSRPDLSWDQRDASWYRPIQSTLATGSFAGVDRGILNSDSQVVALAKSHEYGWVAGVLVPETVALASVRQRAGQQVGLDLAILVIAGLAGFLLTRAIGNPIGELTRAIHAFGQGDLHRRAMVRSGDELEAVADTFNRMAESLQTEHRHLRFLLDAGAAITSSLEVGRVLEQLTENSVKLLGDFVWACVVSSDGKGCEVSTHQGRDQATSEKLAVLFGDWEDELMRTVVRRVLSSGESILSVEVVGAEREDELRALLRAEGISSLLAVPLKATTGTLGLLVGACVGGDLRLTEEQLVLASDLASRAAVSIENALLFREVEGERRQIDALIETMSEGITVADGDGRIVHLNRRAREILGLRPIGGKPIELVEHLTQVDLRYPDGRPVPMDQRPISRAIRGEVFSGMEGVVFRKDGSTTHLLFSSGVVRDASGVVQLAMTIYTDITPLKMLERAREEFISVVAHDLRSPITTIMGYAGILQQLPPDMHGGPREQRALESIDSSSRRLERMVADLLDASRIESRRLSLLTESVEMAALVRTVVDRVGDLANGRAIRLDLDQDLGTVEADPGRIEQVLDNVISNAGKYSFPETEIVVATRRENGEVVVSVSNRGEGIAPEETDQIFSRFHRTRSAHESSAPGLGLGLYISRGLVEAHGGRIWVESVPGEVTTFYFALPARGATSSGEETPG